MNLNDDLESTSATISNLVNYFGQIERDYNISISVRTTNNTINTLIPFLRKYYSNVIPYCMMIKSNLTYKRKCVSFKRMVTASFARKMCETNGSKIISGHFGQCCFGVEEFVLPIISEGIPIGFISVSGYSSDLESTRRKAVKQFERNGIYPEGFEEAISSLRSDLPDPKLLTNLLSPAADLLGIVCVNTRKLMKHSDYSLLSIKSYIDAHYSEPITVSVIAKMLHCSDSYVNHLFKKRSGISIRNYVNIIRIKHAREMLRSTDHPVKDIALEVGYNDTNYFSSVFKLHTNITPSKYREKYKKTLRKI